MGCNPFRVRPVAALRRGGPAALLALLFAGSAAWAQPSGDGAPAGQPEQTTESAPAPPMFDIEHTGWRRTIPETALGFRFQRILDAINGEDTLADTRTGDDVFAPSYLEFSPLPDLERRLRIIQDRTGGLEFIRILQMDERSMAAEMQPAKGGPAWMLFVEITEELPILITGMQTQPMVQRPEHAPRIDAIEEIDGVLADADHQVGFALYRLRKDGTMDVVHRYNAGASMNVGQFGRVYVLGALIAELNTSRVTWHDRVEIRPHHLSLHQGGTLRSGVGSQLTLERLAESMIASDDNKATDAVMDFLGRGAVEEYTSLRVAPSPGNEPFLTTREHTALKLWGDEELRDAYAAADAHERLVMLAEDVATMRDPGDNADRLLAWTEPRHVESIGWFASADDACFLLNELWVESQVEKQIAAEDDEPARLWPILRSNGEVPGRASRWPVRGFFTGAEPGVLTMAWMLERLDGERYAIALVVNDTEAPINATRYGLLMYGVFEWLGLEL